MTNGQREVSAVVSGARVKPPRRVRFTNRRRWLVATLLVVMLLLTSIGVTLNRLGILEPWPLVTTLADLPALRVGVAYNRVAEDAGGDLWVAQSAPGLAKNPTDDAVLTIIAPDQLLGNRVLARLCLGCQSAPGLALARVDDIAPDLTQAHALYVAGWTATQGKTASVPVVVQVVWQPGVAHCAPLSCAVATAILTPDTSVDFIGNPADPNTPLLRQLLRVGVAPVLALTSAHDGTLYCFVSDRGRDGLGDTKFNVIGGFQGLLRYDPLVAQWGEVYVGPAGNHSAQRLSPTSTVTALALDASGRYLYLADADHQAIFRLDLRDPAVSGGSPYAAAGTLTRVAGQALAVGAYGDLAQAAPGWSGDGGAATNARLDGVRGLAVDAAGDLLVSDAGNARLRLITPDDKIWTVAGRGVAAVDGDTGAPLDAGLEGMLGIAADARGRVFVTSGAATDATGQVRVRQLSWGWTSPHATTQRAPAGGHARAGDVVAGLVAANRTVTLATVVSAGACDNAALGCLSAYQIMAGGALPDQAPLAAPQSSPGALPVALTSAPTSVVTAPGTTTTLIAEAGQIAFVPTVPGQPTPAPLALPAGVTATGIAVLAPQTDAQLARLGAAYILVAAQGGASGPALFIYKATADTCGLQPTPTCVYFPGSPNLVATLSITGATSMGGIAVASSDDAHHAFALVALPTDNAVVAIDLTPWLAHGTGLAVTERIALASPTSMPVIRHDGLAAYVGLASGAVGVIDTTGWLVSGVPVAPPMSATVNVGSPPTPVVALAVAGDDSRLFAALTAPSGSGRLVALTVGEFGQPAAPQAISTSIIDAQPRALALLGADARLALIASPAGPGHPGVLHIWATRDPLNPTQWLITPLSLGTAPTVPQPVGIS